MVVFAVWTSQKRAQIPFKPKMATTVLSSKEEQSRNSEDSDAGSERVKKPKKSPKICPRVVEWLICKLIDEYDVCPRLWNIF